MENIRVVGFAAYELKNVAVVTSVNQYFVANQSSKEVQSFLNPSSRKPEEKKPFKEVHRHNIIENRPKTHRKKPDYKRKHYKRGFKKSNLNPTALKCFQQRMFQQQWQGSFQSLLVDRQTCA